MGGVRFYAVLCHSVRFCAVQRVRVFYHPTSRRVLPSQAVTFDESVPFYRLFPYRTAPLPPSPLFLAPGPPPVGPLPPQGPAPSGVSQVDPLPGTVHVEVDVDSGAARGAASGGAASGGAEPASVEPGGADPEGAEPGGAESEGAESGDAEPRGAGGSAAGGTGVGSAGATSLGGAGVTAGAGGTGGAGAAGPAGARTRGTGVAGAGDVGGAGARDPGAGDPGAGGIGAGGAGAGGTGAGGAVLEALELGTLELEALALEVLELEELELETQALEALELEALALEALELEALKLETLEMEVLVLGVLELAVLSQPQLQPDSPLPAPSPYAEQTNSFTERREPESRPASPFRVVHTGRCVPRPRPPPVPCTHVMALRPSSVSLRFPLPSPFASSLPDVPDPESALVRAASPTVPHLLAAVVTDPSFESAAASALVAELVDFAATCHLDYATSLFAESEQEDFECLAAAVPHLVPMLLAPKGDPDVPDIPTPRSYAEEITGPYSSQWVKRPPRSPPVFEAHYVARGFSQRQGRDYELHSLDFSTAFLQGSLHEEIWLRRPHGFTESLPVGTQWSLGRPVYGLRQAPREWHDTLRTTRAALGFASSTADPSLILRTDTSLPSFYILVYDDDLVFATTDTEALDLVLLRFGFLYSSPHSTPLPTGHSLSAPPSNDSSGMGLVLGGRGPFVLTGHADASWELRWLTYLLTNLGEQPRSSSVLYVDNKAMIALCQEHRLEHKTKHTALRYFLARELQQRGQVRLAYVATRANTADIFTEALQSGDHQRFSSVLGLVPTLPHLLTT
ncbi:unnamed protein product [Closterium sp. NIES-53]